MNWYVFAFLFTFAGAGLNARVENAVNATDIACKKYCPECGTACSEMHDPCSSSCYCDTAGSGVCLPLGYDADGNEISAAEMHARQNPSSPCGSCKERCCVLNIDGKDGCMTASGCYICDKYGSGMCLQ